MQKIIQKIVSTVFETIVQKDMVIGIKNLKNDI